MSLKIKRIESELLKRIANILANEAKDELLHGITVTSCSVSPDLSHAKVYFTSLSGMDKKELEAEMEEASGYIRTQVAQAMDLRNTPKLTFIYDDSIESGQRIEKILKDINHE